jgi:hypothetical protein
MLPCVAALPGWVMRRHEDRSLRGVAPVVLNSRRRSKSENEPEGLVIVYPARRRPLPTGDDDGRLAHLRQAQARLLDLLSEPQRCEGRRCLSWRIPDTEVRSQQIESQLLVDREQKTEEPVSVEICVSAHVSAEEVAEDARHGLAPYRHPVKSVGPLHWAVNSRLRLRAPPDPRRLRLRLRLRVPHDSPKPGSRPARGRALSQKGLSKPYGSRHKKFGGRFSVYLWA